MDPISIAAGTIGAKFLEEAVKFLWSEAGKILDRYHKAKEKKEEVIEEPAPPELKLPARRVIDFDAVRKREDDLLDARDRLTRYYQGHRPIAADDERLVVGVQTLLDLVGEVYRQETPRLLLENRQKIDEVEAGGSVTGIRTNMKEGKATSEQEIGIVKGDVTGIDYKS
ncbi:MAG TPA: hypothetical protein VF432_13265 [Thermoanaerobaculia bacterium]